MNRFPKKILLATDGSENTAQATKAAVDIARSRGSEIHLIHVWHDVHTPHAHAFVRSELRQQGREILDEEVKRIEEQGGTVTRSHLREGRTFEEVIKLGDKLEADLLLVGSRGHRGLRRMLVGSNSEAIVHHAHRPVLVVRHGEDVWPPARIVAGDSAEVLIEGAQGGEGPTLVAVGSRGLGPVGRLRLGSVSTKVVRAGLGAVLVYPSRRE